MAKNTDRQAQALQYLQLLQSGVPAADAFKQTYPDGVPTQLQMQKDAAKSQQTNSLVGTGGTIAGLLGVKYAPDAYKYGKGALGLGSTVEAGTTAGATGTTAAATGSGLATDAAANAAWNAGADAAATGANTTVGSGLGLGTTALASGGILAGGLGIKDLYTHDRGTVRSAAQGTASGAAAGAGIGTLLGGPGIGTAIGAGVGLLAGLGSKYAHRPSTRDIAKKHTNQLLNYSNDPTYQNYVGGMREQFNAAPKGPAFNGKYDKFSDYKAAGLDPKNLTGVYGNIKTFGPEWSHLSQDQREAVTQGLIGADLYDSKKGEVIVTDPEKAKQIYANIIGPAQTQPKQTAPKSGAPTKLDRSQLSQTSTLGSQILEVLNSNNKKK